MNHRSGWRGYDFIVNRETGVIEKNVDGGWNWKPVGKVKACIAGNQFQMAVPRAALGLKQSTFDFKWADNLPQPCTMEDFYTTGDVAPSGRFKFRYVKP